MKFALVIVAILDGDFAPDAYLQGVYPDMYECFFARETAIYDLFDSKNGYPPPNFQALCIPTDKYQ